MSIRYKRKAWAVMTQESTLSYDSVGLPQSEKVTLTIVRKLSEAERKKSHREYVKNSRFPQLTYSELKKLP
jgi:hypothetical protein